MRSINLAFEQAREAAGLPPELDLHSLRHSYVTHLTEFDYPERFVSGHRAGAAGSDNADLLSLQDLLPLSPSSRAWRSTLDPCLTVGVSPVLRISSTGCPATTSRSRGARCPSANQMSPATA